MWGGSSRGSRLASRSGGTWWRSVRHFRRRRCGIRGGGKEGLTGRNGGRGRWAWGESGNHEIRKNEMKSWAEEGDLIRKKRRGDPFDPFGRPFDKTHGVLRAFSRPVRPLRPIRQAQGFQQAQGHSRGE